MRASRGPKRKHRTAEQALDALRQSRRRYEETEAGKKRRKDWVQVNRERINAYKRAWRKARASGSDVARSA